MLDKAKALIDPELQWLDMNSNRSLEELNGDDLPAYATVV